MNPAPRILILYAHPLQRHSRNNARLRDAAGSVPNVRLHDVYEAYPDFYIDIQREQALLTESELVVFQHPLHWHGMPALMKEWVDTVLENGWAYGPGGNALRGKDFWLVTTAGSPESAYRAGGMHGRPLVDFLPPLEQMAKLCGMRWLPPLVFYDAQQADAATIAAHAARYREMLLAYPHWAQEPTASAR
jgi:glutathione-regulated potassium-efflux system ancillary protein KefF